MPRRTTSGCWRACCADGRAGRSRSAAVRIFRYRFRGSGPSEDLGTTIDPGLIAASIEGNLERLGVAHLDIYYLGSINEPATVLHEPYMRAFEALKRNGTIRFTGIATHRNEPAVIRAAVAAVSGTSC